MQVLDVGAVLGRIFSIWFGHFLQFTLLAAAVYSPMIVFAFIAWPMGLIEPLDREFAVSIYDLVSFPFNLFLGGLLAATLTYGVIQAIRKRPFTVGECLSYGLQVVVPVIGLNIVLAVIYTVGFALCCVPGIILTVFLFVAVPALVLERTGVFASLDRSVRLTEGNRWQVFAVALVMFAAQFGVSIVVGVALVLLDNPVAQAFLGLGIGILLAPLQACAATVVYHALRELKEGVATDDIAAIFE